MENKPKKSKALIITIIALILLLIAGYLIFKNRDTFGVKTGASIAKIFSPLMSSTNSKNLTTVEAGEDIKKGDNVSVFGTGTNNVPIVMRATGSNSVFGSAYEDINSGNTGQINPNTESNSFFNSFAKFLGGMFNNNPPTIVPVNPPNPYQCTKDGVVVDCNLVPVNPPYPNICSLPKITDTYTGQCIDPSQCLAPKVINGNKCENPSIGGDPDLVAGNVSPTGTTINTETTLSSTITNIGGSSTITSFSSFFTIAKTLPTATPVEVAVITPALESKTGSVAEITYSFDAAGEYQIRACADKKSSSDAGTITESNEDNNCSAPTIFTVTNSLPTGGDLAPGDTTPPGGGITPPAVPATPTNICLDIEQNPLTFTPEEKARLAVLLRKFYLISSTLKTTEDITTIYNEIDQQKNFISQIEDLTSQCYVQTDSKLIQQGWVRHGNPWYTKTTGGTFPYTSENTGYLNPASTDDANTERILNIW